ncbi:MAG: EAL domain-containing protein [Holosporaceae bacterium]|nr:EAL domain-containing protein [Holosporaceae bacterium]
MMNKVRLQPLVRLSDGAICGYEALSRKVEANSYPSAVATLERVASSCKCKNSFRLFVNMTVNDIVNPDFCESFVDVLNEKQMDGSEVVLEVSESTPPDYLSQAQRTLSLLRRYDIKIALDDFGTEYANLSFLKELPVDVVKIDKKFVQEAPSNKRSRSLLQSCAKICHDIGCEVIVEGIETQEHLDCAKNCGADVGQGFLFSSPFRALTSEPFIELYEFAAFSVGEIQKACFCPIHTASTPML